MTERADYVMVALVGILVVIGLVCLGAIFVRAGVENTNRGMYSDNMLSIIDDCKGGSSLVMPATFLNCLADHGVTFELNGDLVVLR